MVLQRTHHLFILIIFVRACLSQKECYRVNSRGGFDRFCCENHVRVNDDCVECKPGTSSLNEQPCQPCSRGRYGFHCGHYCDCKINEKCESVGGCRLMNNVITTEFRLSSLMSSVDTIRAVFYTRSNQHQSSVLVHEKTSAQVTMEPPTSTAQHASHTIQTLEQTSVLFRENANLKGLSAREVIVYSLGSAAFGIICTVMCVIFVCFHRGKTMQLKKISNVHSENQVNEVDNSCYNSYESIDENSIYDDNILDDNADHYEDKYSKSASEGSTLDSEKFGYLLPFTTIIPNNGREEHVYCGGVTSIGGSSVSSVLNDGEMGLEQINPYEQLQTELTEQFKSEYTNLHAVYYLELIDIRTEQNSSNKFITETLQTCSDSTTASLKNNLRKFRRWYSNDNISDEQMLCATSKVNTKIERFYSECKLTDTFETKFEKNSGT